MLWKVIGQAIKSLWQLKSYLSSENSDGNVVTKISLKRENDQTFLVLVILDIISSTLYGVRWNLSEAINEALKTGNPIKGFELYFHDLLIITLKVVGANLREFENDVKNALLIDKFDDKLKSVFLGLHQAENGVLGEGSERDLKSRKEIDKIINKTRRKLKANSQSEAAKIIFAIRPRYTDEKIPEDNPSGDNLAQVKGDGESVASDLKDQKAAERPKGSRKIKAKKDATTGSGQRRSEFEEAISDLKKSGDLKSEKVLKRDLRLKP
jgi:hypothetical protein